MEWTTELYAEAIQHWPDGGQVILAKYTATHIVVYQAYNEKIADAILAAQCFHTPEVAAAGYIIGRMTWIKPNFLWMMYRSNWAKSKNQERILALWLKRKCFDSLIQNGVLSSFEASQMQNRQEWQTKLRDSNIRMQWDPDHNPNGSKYIARRALQIGVRGDALMYLSQHAIDKVEDVTSFVVTQSQNEQSYANWLSTLLIPHEREYFPDLD